jgi:hypothetical protein
MHSERFCLKLIWGRFFVLLSTENHFPQKIPWNFLEKRFFEAFSAENSIFPNIIGENFSRNFTQNFPRKKMCDKSAPGHSDFKPTVPARWKETIHVCLVRHQKK